MSPRIVRIVLAVLLALEVALLLLGPQAGEHRRLIDEALASGKRPEWWNDAAMGIRYAAWINGGLLLLLLATVKWWTRPLAMSAPGGPESSVQNPKWFWPLALIAMLACLGLRLPLAGKSLWWDEAWVVQQVSHGKWRPDSKHPDQLRFLAHDWKRCAFYYQKPTNHVPMSLAQKTSFNVWRMLTGAPRDQFNDLAARAPALIASCAAVLLLALLLQSWGWPGAGVAGAFVLALHPWHVRYGVDARGYALVVPLCLGALLAITHVLRSRSATLFPWMCWAVTEFLWLWAYPNAVLDLAALNVVALVLLLRQVDARGRWPLLFRFCAVHLFAAISFVQVFVPNLMQARRWAGQEADAHVLDAALAKSTLSQLCFGVEFANPGVPEGVGLPYFSNLSPAAQAALVVVVIAAVILGTAALVRTTRRGACLVVTLIASSLAFALLTRVAHTYFYPRFIISALPCIAILIGSAVCCIVAIKGKLRWVPVVGGIAVAGLTYAPLSGRQLGVLLERPIAPLHEAASFVQQEAAHLDKPPLIVCYGLGREVMPIYEPRSLPVEDATGLELAMKQAGGEQRQLFVIQGYNSFNRQLLGTGFKLLDDHARFEEVEAFRGIDPEFYFRVFRMK